MSNRKFADFVVAVEQLINDHLQNQKLEIEVVKRPNLPDRIHLRMVEVTDDVSAESREAPERTASGKAAG